MAGRTSASLGIGVAITVLGVLSLALFVLTTVFYGKLSKAQGDLRTLNADIEQYVKASERNQDDVRALMSAAQSDKKSLVRHLADSMSTTMQRVTGSRRDSAAALEAKLQAVKGADTQPLLAVLGDRESRIASLQSERDQADAARRQALADLTAEGERVKSIETRHAQTVTALNAEIGKYKEEVERYREGTNQVRGDMDARISTIRTEAQTREDELVSRLSKLQEESLVQQELISKLRGERNRELFRGTDEYALVDGAVIDVIPVDNACVVGIGARQKLVLGMTFSVYSDAASIKPDAATGEYPRGKAALEVIAVDPESAKCRILWETKGNPVVSGDVIANPIYDPNKKYVFLVYGNFDANGDGLATPLERADIAALIEGWGGRVVDDLAGDVDFVVLGDRPVVPPRPAPETPVEVVRQFVEMTRVAEQYDNLFRQAVATGLPVLNQNRLNTLIGRTPPRPSR